MYKFIVIYIVLLLASIPRNSFGQLSKQEEIRLISQISAIKKETNFIHRQIGFENLASELIQKLESPNLNIKQTSFQPYLECIRKNENTNYADTLCTNLLYQIEISDSNYTLFDNLITFTISNDLPISKTLLTNYYYDQENMGTLASKIKRRFVELTREKNNIVGLELILNYLNDENGNPTSYLWNSLEIDQLVKDLKKAYGPEAAHKFITQKTTSLLKSDTSWAIKQLDLRMLQMEQSEGYQTLNSIRSNPKFSINTKQVEQVRNQIETGQYYLTNKTYQHFHQVLTNLQPDTSAINRKYERLIFDINQVLSQHMGIKEFLISINYFNHRNATVLESPFDLQYIKNGIIDKLSFQYDLAKVIQISNTCFDYLALAYYNLAQIRSSKDFNPASELSSSMLMNYKTSSEKFQFSKLKNDIQTSTANQPISYLNELKNRIERIEVKARVYDLKNFIVQEQLAIHLIDGKTIKFQYLGDIPYRYYNLLTIDPYIFDVSQFCFAYRALLYSNNTLESSTVDMQLRNSIDGLGLILNVLNKKTDLKTFENELFLNSPNSSFYINKSFGRIRKSTGKSEFFSYIDSKPQITSKLNEQFIAIEPFKHGKIFFSEDSLQSIALKDIFRQAVLSVNYNIIASMHNLWTATQYSRLNVTPTPGDLEIWVSKEERRRISEKNDYRTNLIRGCYARATENNKNESELKRFMLFNPNMIEKIESDIAVIDISRKKLFNIIKLTAVTSEISYLFTEINIDEALIQKLFFSHKYMPTFFNSYNIDISDTKSSGLNYFLNLGDYQKQEKAFYDKFIYHGLDFQYTYPTEQLEMINKKPIIIDNKNFEISLSLGQNLLWNEKAFLTKFHSSQSNLLPASFRAIEKYFNQNIETNNNQTQAVNAKFSDTFEPFRDRWNNEWGISISIGIGPLNFFSFSFGSSVFNLSIPPIDINNYKPQYIPISLL